MFPDYHTHPQGHRHQPYTLDLLQPWADAARSKGVSHLCFTDHDRYHAGVSLDAVHALQDKNPDLNLRVGIELDNDPATSAAGRTWVEQNWDRLDFILGSVHYLTGKSAMFDSSDQRAQSEERPIEIIYQDYIGQVSHLIDQGNIDCLSHLDLIKIHGLTPPPQSLELFLPLLDKIKKADLAMEINTAGWRKPVGEQYPRRDLISAAVQKGIPITLSSDAHSHVQISEGYPQLAELLRDLRIHEIAIYQNHRRTLLPIKLTP
jgi:histidinol-phosphatase (PHP family)